MRDKDKALIHRLRGIVEFVESMGKGIAVIENGDCVGLEEAKQIRELTGKFTVVHWNDCSHVLEVHTR